MLAPQTLDPFYFLHSFSSLATVLVFHLSQAEVARPDAPAWTAVRSAQWSCTAAAAVAAAPTARSSPRPPTVTRPSAPYTSATVRSHQSTAAHLHPLAEEVRWEKRASPTRMVTPLSLRFPGALKEEVTVADCYFSV